MFFNRENLCRIVLLWELCVKNSLLLLMFIILQNCLTRIPTGVMSSTEMLQLMIPFHFILLVNDEHLFHIQYGKRILGHKTHIRIRSYLLRATFKLLLFWVDTSIILLGQIFFLLQNRKSIGLIWINPYDLYCTLIWTRWPNGIPYSQHTYETIDYNNKINPNQYKYS